MDSSILNYKKYSEKSIKIPENKEKILKLQNIQNKIIMKFNAFIVININ